MLTQAFLKNPALLVPGLLLVVGIIIHSRHLVVNGTSWVRLLFLALNLVMLYGLVTGWSVGYVLAVLVFAEQGLTRSYRAIRLRGQGRGTAFHSLAALTSVVSWVILIQ